MIRVRMLILGGAWRLGRLLVAESVSRGIDVTVFNRRRNSSYLPASVRHIYGDRKTPESLRALDSAGPWNIVIDVNGKVPAEVGRSARMLADMADRYVSVSTNLVYRDWPHKPVDEQSAVRECDPDFDPGEWSFEQSLYGAMKAGCEQACSDAFGDRVLLLRLHEIIGQYEDLAPLQWWMERMRRGGPVLVPGPDHAIQPIDVSDVARFMVDMAERGTTGIMNIGAPTEGRTFGDLMQACMATADVPASRPPELVWVDGLWLLAQGVKPWTELPLWSSAAATWQMDVTRALAAGLTCRPLAETVADSWQWLTSPDRTLKYDRTGAFGLDAAREQDLLNQWAHRQGNPLVH